MCGIVGAIGNINQKELKAFRDLLLFDVVRGQDSTGVVHVPLGYADKEVTVKKDVGHPLNLWDPMYNFSRDDIFNDRGVITKPARALIGHNRAATLGAVTINNAHPFNFGSVYGVHNGSLWSTYGLEGDHDVDSKCIYETIAKHGIDETWKEIRGAAALVWWDEDTERLCMIRNDERPLFTITNAEENCMFFASEEWMLNVALSRNGIAVDKKGSNSLKRPEALPIHTLREFSATSINFKMEEDRPVKKFVSPKATGLTTYGKGGTTPGFKTSTPPRTPENKNARINLGWGKGKSKADKKLRGMEVWLQFSMASYDSKSQTWDYWITCRSDDGKSLKVYPNTYAEWEKLDKLIKDHPGKKVYAKINTRPRVTGKTPASLVYFASSDKLKVSRTIASKTMGASKTLQDIVSQNSNNSALPAVDDQVVVNKVKLYPVYGGVKLPETEYHRALKAAGSCCANCNNTLTVEDEGLEWLNRESVVCKECAGDPFIQQIKESM
jgi:hypothetical protein